MLSPRKMVMWVLAVFGTALAITGISTLLGDDLPAWVQGRINSLLPAVFWASIIALSIVGIQALRRRRSANRGTGDSR